ncbi:MAG TPA: recombinase family protein [Candidatus Paceibacterota bacterium]
MIIGYARVSTKGQLKEGHSIEVQTRDILDRYDGAEIRVEQYTGTTIDRPIFNKLINDLKQGDTLVVTKLDRLARNTVEGISIVQDLFIRGIAVHVINIGLLENTSMGKFFLTTLLAVAEMERNTIIERTQTGKAIAKTKEGFKEGRPKTYTPKQINNAIEMLKNNSYTEVAEITGISKSTLIREVRKRKVT